jgi:hypothetical protein
MQASIRRDPPLLYKFVRTPPAGLIVMYVCFLRFVKMHFSLVRQ